MGRRDQPSDDLIASINHRLGLIDSMSHRIALIEQVNFAVTELGDRVRLAADSAETSGQLVRNVDAALVAIAERLDAIERRLLALESPAIADQA